MANTCCNTIKIVGSKRKLDLLNKAICAIIDAARAKNKYNYPGMEDLLLFLNYTPEQIKDISCREWFNNGKPEFKDGVLTINTESAWNFQGWAWELVKNKYPSIDIYFRSEELGCEIFCTNDTSGLYFQDKYLLDWYRDDEGEQEYFSDDCSFIEYVQDNIDSSVSTFEEAMRALKDIQDDSSDDYANLYEIEYDTSYNLVY